jgi:hypothetical protein
MAQVWGSLALAGQQQVARSRFPRTLLSSSAMATHSVSDRPPCSGPHAAPGVDLSSSSPERPGSCGLLWRHSRHKLLLNSLRLAPFYACRLRYQRISLCGPPGSLTPGVKALASRAGALKPHTYTHTLYPTLTYIHKHINTLAHTHTHTHMRAHTHTHSHTHTHTHTRTMMVFLCMLYKLIGTQVIVNLLPRRYSSAGGMG